MGVSAHYNGFCVLATNGMSRIMDNGIATKHIH